MSTAPADAAPTPSPPSFTPPSPGPAGPGDSPALQPLAPQDWPRWADFVHTHNQGPGGGPRCLHAQQGDTVEALAKELAALPADGAAFWGLRGTDGDRWGWIGAAVDPARTRAWLRGPLLAPAAPPGSADRLLRALLDGLDGLACLDAFPTEQDTALNAVYERAGFTCVDRHRVMRAPLAALPRPQDPAVRAATLSDLPAVLALHHALFPSSYLGDEDLRAAVQAQGDAAGGPARRVWATADAAGYAVATDEPDMDEVYIDFLGVDPGWRGAGLGQRLLHAAMAWGRERGRGHAALTVRQDRLAAMSLYRRSGFEEVSCGVQWRLSRGPAAG